MSTPKPAEVLTHTNHPYLGIGWQWNVYLYGIFTLMWPYFASTVTKWYTTEIKSARTIGSKTEDERTEASNTYQSSLPWHRQTMRPLFIWYFHSNVAIFCIKSNKMKYHGNEECTKASRTKDEHTQANGSLDTPIITQYCCHNRTRSGIIFWLVHPTPIHPPITWSLNGL